MPADDGPGAFAENDFTTEAEGVERQRRQVEEVVLFESSVFVRRLIRLSTRCEIICDALPEDGMEIQFVRWTTGSASDPASFTFSGESTGLQSDPRMGTIFTRGPSGDRPALWSPRGLSVAESDRHARLSIVEGCEVESWWELSGSPTLELDVTAPEGTTIFWPMVVFGDDTETRVSDIVQLRDIELRRLVKSDWFDAESVADLWKYFVDGSIYDPRDTGRGRFRCQQCAYAWWSYLMALHRETGKPHYRALARAVAWTVCIDLREDGSWRHGFWREEPEIHARFFWDGVRLLLAEHSVGPDPALLGAARRAGEFALENLSAPLDNDRLWWLHDSMEDSEPLRVQTAPLGRSPQNSLCLNTHVQALCVLARLSCEADDESPFQDAYLRGMGGLEDLLKVRGFSALSGILDRLLPAALAWKVPHGFVERVLRFLVYRASSRLYWWARKGIPGVVFPKGYLDRDLGATMLADEYHVINLKDLLELYHLDPKPWLRNTIEDAAGFIGSLDYRRALERSPIWAEWVDVLTAWNVEPAVVELDSGEAEGAVLEKLGAFSLDAFCHRAGLWPLVGEDPAEADPR